MSLGIRQGHALDLIAAFDGEIDLLTTDPPYAMGGEGAEHALSATVATGLREAAYKLRKSGWAVVFAASSWRSTYYMIEAVRGVLEPVRIGHWDKPAARTKVRTPGWAWASVNAVAFRRPGAPGLGEPSALLDYILAPPPDHRPPRADADGGRPLGGDPVRGTRRGDARPVRRFRGAVRGGGAGRDARGGLRDGPAEERAGGRAGRAAQLHGSRVMTTETTGQALRHPGPPRGHLEDGGGARAAARLGEDVAWEEHHGADGCPEGGSEQAAGETAGEAEGAW